MISEARIKNFNERTFVRLYSFGMIQIEWNRARRDPVVRRGEALFT